MNFDLDRLHNRLAILVFAHGEGDPSLLAQAGKERKVGLPILHLVVQRGERALVQVERGGHIELPQKLGEYGWNRRALKDAVGAPQGEQAKPRHHAQRVERHSGWLRRELLRRGAYPRE